MHNLTVLIEGVWDPETGDADTGWMSLSILTPPHSLLDPQVVRGMSQPLACCMQHSSLCGQEAVEFLAKGSASPQHLSIPFIPSLLGQVQNFLEKFFRETLAIQMVSLKCFLKFKQEAILASGIALIRVI